MAPPPCFFTIGIVSILLAVTKAKETVPIFVFGDSLADNGNNNNLNVPLIDKSNFPYNGIDFPGGDATGRFSNGFNSADFIAQLLGFSIGPPSYASITKPCQMLNGVNFASGGSGIQDYTGPGTINMATQIKYFQNVTQVLQQNLGRNQAKRKIAASLFVIVTANNDMFEYFYATGAANSTINEQFINNLVDRFIQHLTSLYNSGARKFYIAGTAQVGCVPFLTSRNPAGTCIDIMNQLSMQYNTIALLRVKQLSSQLRGMRYSYSNVYRMASDIRENPNSFGITDLQSACCGGGKFNGEVQCTVNATFCANRDNHFFWDWFHPTQAVSRIISRLAFYGSPIYATPINIKKLVWGSQYIESYLN
ncbi:hypothetical protein LUZ61_018858 [Rhynchospora tenuis]|uniref:Uncharacterized protein n=1 Tax=Rhynchospora tenuis TaxID=198213 RepID=A0AAD5ZA21_9POAL|nr:hypothetical protein LUZ61_018858 [Rhynchospora tenuis]